jgi:hypothetical protein
VKADNTPAKILTCPEYYVNNLNKRPQWRTFSALADTRSQGQGFARPLNLFARLAGYYWNMACVRASSSIRLQNRAPISPTLSESFCPGRSVSWKVVDPCLLSLGSFPSYSDCDNAQVDQRTCHGGRH